MSTRPTIAFDLDDVLAALVPTWLEKYNEYSGDDLTQYDIKTWDIAGYAKKVKPEVFHAMLSPSFYALVPAYPDACRAIIKAAEFSDVYIVSSCRSSLGVRYFGMAGAKELWIERNLPGNLIKDVVFMHDKAMFRCDFMIDDNPENLYRRSGGMLIDRPWNRLVEALAVFGRYPNAESAVVATREYAKHLGYF